MPGWWPFGGYERANQAATCHAGATSEWPNDSVTPSAPPPAPTWPQTSELRTQNTPQHNWTEHPTTRPTSITAKRLGETHISLQLPSLSEVPHPSVCPCVGERQGERERERVTERDGERGRERRSERACETGRVCVGEGFRFFFVRIVVVRASLSLSRALSRSLRRPPQCNSLPTSRARCEPRLASLMARALLLLPLPGV